MYRHKKEKNDILFFKVLFTINFEYNKRILLLFAIKDNISFHLYHETYNWNCLYF